MIETINEKLARIKKNNEETLGKMESAIIENYDEARNAAKKREDLSRKQGLINAKAMAKVAGRMRML